MARVSSENQFLKLAQKMGLEQMLKDVNTLLKFESLTEAQRITNEEMKAQIEKYLEELK